MDRNKLAELEVLDIVAGKKEKRRIDTARSSAGSSVRKRTLLDNWQELIM